VSDKEIVRLACIYAVQDRESFIGSYHHMQNHPDCKEAKNYLKKLKAYMERQSKKTGVKQADFGDCELLTLEEIMKRAVHGLPTPEVGK
jgi:3-dehydroquinate dehydratase